MATQVSRLNALLIILPHLADQVIQQLDVVLKEFVWRQYNPCFHSIWKHVVGLCDVDDDYWSRYTVVPPTTEESMVDEEASIPCEICENLFPMSCLELHQVLNSFSPCVHFMTFFQITDCMQILKRICRTRSYHTQKGNRNATSSKPLRR